MHAEKSLHSYGKSLFLPTSVCWVHLVVMVTCLSRLLATLYVTAGVFVHLLSQFSSVARSCPVLCNPPNCSTPGFPVLHYLLEFPHTHIHWVGDAIQPSHPLSLPSPPAPNPSQHQSLFRWVNSSHEVAKVLEFQLLHQSFQRTPRTDLLKWTGWISLKLKGIPRVFSNTTVQKHQFFSTQLSWQCSSHIHTWLQEKP